MKFFSRPKPAEWGQVREMGKSQFVARWAISQTLLISALWLSLHLAFNLARGKHPLLTWGDSIFCLLWALYALWQGFSIWHDHKYRFLQQERPSA